MIAAIDPSTVDMSHCTLHMSWWTKQKVYKLIILYSEHHTAECLVAYATVESSYCIVDILNITLHISRSTYSTVDMSHCTLHMHKVHTVHSFKINMFHGGHVSLNIAHVVYYIILHSSGHIERHIAHIKIFFFHGGHVSLHNAHVMVDKVQSKLIILCSGHHTAECLIAHATVESS